MRGASPSKVQGDAQRVRSLEKVHRHTVEHHRGPRVRLDDVPAAVDGQARIRVVRLQNPVDTVPHRRHLGVVERVFGIHQGEARRDQQLVLLAQHVERGGQAQHHRATRGRPPGLDEADMTRRHLGTDCQIELAQAAAFSHSATTSRAGEYGLSCAGHQTSLADPRYGYHYLAGNCIDYLVQGTVEDVN